MSSTAPPHPAAEADAADRPPGQNGHSVDGEVRAVFDGADAILMEIHESGLGARPSPELMRNLMRPELVELATILRVLDEPDPETPGKDAGLIAAEKALRAKLDAPLVAELDAAWEVRGQQGLYARAEQSEVMREIVAGVMEIPIKTLRKTAATLVEKRIGPAAEAEAVEPAEGAVIDGTIDGRLTLAAVEAATGDVERETAARLKAFGADREPPPEIILDVGPDAEPAAPTPLQAVRDRAKALAPGVMNGFRHPGAGRPITASAAPPRVDETAPATTLLDYGDFLAAGHKASLWMDTMAAQLPARQAEAAAIARGADAQGFFEISLAPAKVRDDGQIGSVADELRKQEEAAAEAAQALRVARTPLLGVIQARVQQLQAEEVEQAANMQRLLQAFAANAERYRTEKALADAIAQEALRRENDATEAYFAQLGPLTPPAVFPRHRLADGWVYSRTGGVMQGPAEPNPFIGDDIPSTASHVYATKLRSERVGRHALESGAEPAEEINLHVLFGGLDPKKCAAALTRPLTREEQSVLDPLPKNGGGPKHAAFQRAFWMGELSKDWPRFPIPPMEGDAAALQGQLAEIDVDAEELKLELAERPASPALGLGMLVTDEARSTAQELVEAGGPFEDRPRTPDWTVSSVEFRRRWAMRIRDGLATRAAEEAREAGPAEASEPPKRLGIGGARNLRSKNRKREPERVYRPRNGRYRTARAPA